jgi:two-component system sensor histidine kinase UhpB
MLRNNIHPDDAAVLDQTFRQALREGAVFELEHRIVRPDGNVRVVYDLAQPYFDENGKLVRYVGTTLDITERKRAEEALLRSRAELEERVKERTKELADSQKQLRNLYSHLQSLREEERTNIAREIHDDLGQALTALKMDLSWIAGKLRGDKGLKEKLNADVDQVDKTIQAVKRVCTELRPGILDHLGLAAAIEWQAGEFQKRAGIKCEVVFDPEDVVVDTSLSTSLFRIFQESLTNVMRHARATEVKASFRRTSNSIILEIADNGIGITEKDISKANSFGLQGMRERVYPWGGKVTVSGVENKGTIVEVIIPVTTGEPS